MIVSASRRTDIPRFHVPWLLHRLREGFAYVRNPVVRDRVSRVPLTPDAVDCIAFWTKDPAPLIPHLDELAPHPYFVQFTLNAYGQDIERGLPRKARLIETFRALAQAAGSERMVWRYSPILLGGPYTVGHHLHYFEAFARALEGATDTCRISFLEVYPKIAPRMAALGLSDVPDQQKGPLARRLASIGAAHGIAVSGCGNLDPEACGFPRTGCIDRALVERACGRKLARTSAPGQRTGCSCLPSVDIGTYDTCANGCVYCYANRAAEQEGRVAGSEEDVLTELPVPAGLRRSDETSPLLCDRIRPNDTVTDHPAALLATDQLALFPA